MPRDETLGWRDELLSARHRLYGPCFAADVDLLLVEYDRCRPSAIVEYKHWRYATGRAESDPGVRVIRTLGDMAGLPTLIVVYDPASWVFRVVAFNNAGESLVGDKRRFTEVEWVELLHRMRGIDPDPAILATLNATYRPLDGDDDWDE